MRSIYNWSVRIARCFCRGIHHSPFYVRWCPQCRRHAALELSIREIQPNSPSASPVWSPRRLLICQWSTVDFSEAFHSPGRWHPLNLAGSGGIHYTNQKRLYFCHVCWRFESAYNVNRAYQNSETPRARGPGVILDTVSESSHLLSFNVPCLSNNDVRTCWACFICSFGTCENITMISKYTSWNCHLTFVSRTSIAL